MKMKKIRTVIRSFCALLAAVSLTFLGAAAVESHRLPDEFAVSKKENLQIDGVLPITAEYSDVLLSGRQQSQPLAGSSYLTELKLFGLIPIKSVEVNLVDPLYVVPSGEPFGIKIYIGGVVVVGFSDIDTQLGTLSPARDCGIKLGDNIISIAGKQVDSNEDVSDIISQSDTEVLEVRLLRNGEFMTLYLTAQKSVSDGKYKAGMWVRDSSAGIGTLTFYSPTSGIAAGLGHGICDVDTNELMPLSYGEMVEAEIFDIEKSVSGSPGELCGTFKTDTIGSLLVNSQIGVFGEYKCNIEIDNMLPVAMKQEIKCEKATVITTIDENGPREFACEIEKVQYNDNNLTQNMIIKITDAELLTKCGGIVQGMSGSPIIQNGKLVGALTHVFVGEPSKGYGIFAETMYNYTTYAETER